MLQKIECQECGGTGSGMEEGCCGNALRDGSCCGNSIPVQVQCQACSGMGHFEIDIVENEHACAGCGGMIGLNFKVCYSCFEKQFVVNL